MDTIRLFFAGDFCSTSAVSPVRVSQELCDMIASCDLKSINFEVPLKPDVTLPPRKRPRLCQHDDVPDFLKSIGFNLFPIATNHTFDFGDEGFRKTKDALGDAAFGAGTYDEAYRVKVTEVDGVRVGFLALCFAAYTGVFDDCNNHGGLGCAYINDLRVNHVILEAKKDVDYLIILAHDGIEYIDVPLPETIARYRDFIDYGADAVIGTHPHCPQGWETYKDRPIFYSLGNFLFNSKEGYDYRAWNRPHWYEGLCVVLIINTANHKISDEVTCIRNVDNLEVVIDHSALRSNHNRQLCNYLIDQMAYMRCFRQQMVPIVMKNYLVRLDTTFHDVTFSKTVKAAVKYVWNRIKGRKLKSDRGMQWLLKHDIQRAGLLRVIKSN